MQVMNNLWWNIIGVWLREECIKVGVVGDVIGQSLNHELIT